MTDDVQAHLDALASEKRRQDAGTLIELMRRVTGLQPKIWGSIVGFGDYHYRYASGREGDAPAAGFAPREAATTVYVLDGVSAHADLLPRLGPHTTGEGCIYLKDVDKVDLEVLGQIVARSYATLRSGTFTDPARDSAAGAARDV